MLNHSDIIKSLCSSDQLLPVFSAVCSLTGAVEGLAGTLLREPGITPSQLSHHQGLLGSQWSWGQPGKSQGPVGDCRVVLDSLVAASPSLCASVSLLRSASQCRG